MNPANRPRRRPGFTLVELLVVIVIIGILAALLIPVLAGAVRTARNAQVSGEIQGLQQALQSFKDRYGEFPPSRVILMENGFYNTAGPSSAASPASGAALGSVTWFSSGSLALGNPSEGDATIVFSPNDLSYGQLCQRTLRALRKFWPNARFSTSGAIYPDSAGNWHDFNGNGVLDGAPILLQGNECLAFFLGGIPNFTGDTIGMTGFAKAPQFPFQNEATTTNRTPPSYNGFKAAQLLDDDGDGIPGYADSIGSQDDARYFAFFSSYHNAYDPNDVNFAEPNDNLTVASIGRAFRINFGVGAWYEGVGNVIASPAPNPYTSSLPIPDYLTSSAGAKPPVYINADTYQIISAGQDRRYGLGGQFKANDSENKVPLEPRPSSGPFASSGIALPDETTDPTIRVLDRDNLTNFTSARLE